MWLCDTPDSTYRGIAMIVDLKTTHIYEIEDPIIQSLVNEFEEWSAEQGRSPEVIENFDFPLVLEGELRWWAEEITAILHQSNIEIPDYLLGVAEEIKAEIEKYLFI